MSTTQYATRYRARQALTNDPPVRLAAGMPRANSESMLSSVSSSPGGVTPRAPSPANSVDTPIRLYSDIVLTRIPSMPGGLEATPVGLVKSAGLRTEEMTADKSASVDPTEESVVGSKSEKERSKVTFDLKSGNESSSDEQSAESGDDQTSAEWTSVQRKRGRRSSSREVPAGGPRASELNQEQEHLVRLAEKKLTGSDRKRIETRERAYIVPREGPSKEKGKAPDPRNWGGTEFEDDEVDVDAQRAALESFRLAKGNGGGQREPDSDHETSDKPQGDSSEVTEPREDTWNESASYVSRFKAEAAVRAVKERLTNRYEARLRELEKKLALKEGSKKPKKHQTHLEATNPVNGMVERVLE
ncbi:hypothetical protein DEU56DRAFT_762140 [Suillus clintonianus]|uniref:uncharacterized protein n=1 Tax=Suillus clintonianus TaxID=1904413 RepID=UPI001B876035|nr:uncharacterized protein DEU56DRAFT_762140 [Suillus clintonianus]KAG2111732.1 hypothetical protein DEU56DRAFT_762140 [Suillus clintonianus]